GGIRRGGGPVGQGEGRGQRLGVRVEVKGQGPAGGRPPGVTVPSPSGCYYLRTEEGPLDTELDASGTLQPRLLVTTVCFTHAPHHLPVRRHDGHPRHAGILEDPSSETALRMRPTAGPCPSVTEDSGATTERTCVCV
ncbi:hypothetical protein chiPu_0023635, partial [Chiloscyllium punctatum]|nr:hypothetical protein [Chiloscyllium punctatum]